MGFVWEAGTQVVKLYLQPSVMSLLGVLGRGGPQDPRTPVLSHQKVMPVHVTGKKLGSFSASSRMLPKWL